MKKSLFLLTVFASSILVLNSFKAAETSSATYLEPASPKEMNKLWADYKNWYRTTKDAPNTGDPTGFLGGLHKGTKAYREIYINKVGEPVGTGNGPYVYPAGTVVVKEAYSNMKAWEAKKSPQLTIMVKLKKGESPETGDWGYVMGATGTVSTGTSKWAKFCNKCHIYAAGKDYIFVNSEFLKNEKK